ncbi:hypothetical protein EV363DRAFT_1464378 [Boletus edulis]|nr:hypothetical protein EV363DRAFT_1464378 [Boletus edulis]
MNSSTQPSTTGAMNGSYSYAANEDSAYPAAWSENPYPSTEPHLELNPADNSLPPGNELSLQQMAPPANEMPPVLDMDFLPLSAFTLDHRFGLLLWRKAINWQLTLMATAARIGYMLLSGQIPPTTSLTRDQALAEVVRTIEWHRILMNSPNWFPTGSLELRVDPLMPSFRSEITDPTFCDFLYGQLVNIPMVFFEHVRSSIQRLVLPHPEATAYEYPRFPIISAPQFMGREMQRQLLSLLEWDSRWGYNHWHRFTHDTSGYTVLWFADPGTHSIIAHALRTRNSAGWLAVLYPQEAPPYQLTEEVPVSIETIAFVLAALAMEIRRHAREFYDSPVVNLNYILDFQTERNHIFDALSKVLNGTMSPGNQEVGEDMRLGLNSWLNIGRARVRLT